MPPEAPSQLLDRVKQSLPSSAYFDPEVYDRELDAIWYRSWVCVARSRELARDRDFIVVQVGAQSIIVCRDLDDRLQAFHNTCRHRGSRLCTGSAGRFRGPSIICPYHGWTYSLSGELLGARHQLSQSDFRLSDYPLYSVAVGEWGGFVFVNLKSDAAPPLERSLGEMPELFANWGIDDLVVGHRIEKTLECNWKIFWENFNECFHCPGVHPELCRVVPTYGLGVSLESDVSGAPAEANEEPTLAPGAVTWTLDGSTHAPLLPGLSAAEANRGQTFGVQLPTMFVVAHPDYVRSVRMLPRGPEQTELVVEWLFEPETLEQPEFDLEHCVALGRAVVEQDAGVCELNQLGVHSMRHDHGILVGQEYEVYEFQQWVRQALGESG